MKAYIRCINFLNNKYYATPKCIIQGLIQVISFNHFIFLALVSIYTTRKCGPISSCSDQLCNKWMYPALKSAFQIVSI